MHSIFTCSCPHFSAYNKQATPQSKFVNCCCLVIALYPTLNQDFPPCKGQHTSNHSITAKNAIIIIKILEIGKSFI